MNILVTGGCGFIGSHLVDYWHGRAGVRVIDDMRTGFEANLEGCEVQLFKGSILDPELLEAAMAGVDYVFHLAAMVSVPESMDDPEACLEINAKGTLRVLEAAARAGVRKVCFSSSSAVYGDEPTLPKREEMAPWPQSPYAVTKLSGEYYCRCLGAHLGVPAVCLRYFNVFGPRQNPDSAYAAVVPAFIRRALKGEDLVIFGDGTQTRDFVYVKDVVSANVFCAEHPDAVGIYNVGYGSAVSVAWLADTILRLTGSTARVRHDKPRAGDVMHSVACVDKLAAMGFTCNGTLEGGLQETIASFREANDAT